MAQNVMRQNQNVLSYRAMKRRETFAAYGFILPTLVGFLLFVLGPMLASFLLSMYDWNLLTPPVFVGLGNWQQLFADARIGGIYLTTAKLSLMVVFCNMTLGLTLAVLLDRKMPHLLRNFFRISYFFPYVVSGVAVSLIWTFLFNRDLGPLNYYLGQLGFPARINWLNSSQ